MFTSKAPIKIINKIYKATKESLSKVKTVEDYKKVETDLKKQLGYAGNAATGSISFRPIRGFHVYEGKWFTPLCDALKAFVKSTQECVTGEVKMMLYKGNIIKQGTTSPYSLYNESLASFTTGDLYDHHDAEGFINLFGLSLKVRAMALENAKKNDK